MGRPKGESAPEPRLPQLLPHTLDVGGWKHRAAAQAQAQEPQAARRASVPRGEGTRDSGCPGAHRGRASASTHSVSEQHPK